MKFQNMITLQMMLAEKAFESQTLTELYLSIEITYKSLNRLLFHPVFLQRYR